MESLDGEIDPSDAPADPALALALALAGCTSPSPSVGEEAPERAEITVGTLPIVDVALLPVVKRAA